MSKQVLGKGLSALIPTAGGSTAEETGYRLMALDRIAPNPMQPRREFDQEKLQELAGSLKHDGVMQPLVVRKNGAGYTIVAGERRFRAASLAGLSEVPVVVIDEVDDTRMLELALVENIHREDLNPLELAEAYRRLMDQCGLTQNEMAGRVGKSRASVANHVRLLTLPDSIKKLLRDGHLTEGHARAILALPSEAQMLEMADRIVSGTMSVRQVEQATGGRRKKRRLTIKRKNPIIVDMESHLKRLLGTSVKVTPGLKAGKIEIEFYGDDDLDRLWQLFRRLEA
ncbi:MAG: ParB/RepB/Spo0J family partition protein [candidate division Zixibacteria bacterium]|nr:ParB/RepB/Spo0J family partition protein [candidate division Zixibacteria bacterium]